MPYYVNAILWFSCHHFKPEFNNSCGVFATLKFQSVGTEDNLLATF